MKTKLAAALGLLLLAALVALGLSRIRFDVDILKLLPANLPQVEGLALFLERFARPDELVVTVEAPDAPAAESAARQAADLLRARPDLARRVVDAPPWEQESGDVAELVAYLLLNQPSGTVDALIERLSSTGAPTAAAAAAERLRESFSPEDLALASYDPFGLGADLLASGVASRDFGSEFVSADGTFRVIYLEAPPLSGGYRGTVDWVRGVRAALAAVPATVGVTGEPAFVADISSTMEWDMKSSAFVTLAVIALLFWLAYRRIRPLALLLALLGLTFVIALGLAGVLLSELTMIGVGFASILIGLSVDYGYLIHEKSRQAPASRSALRRVAVQNIVWTAGTTAAAFFALNLSRLPGLSQLGNLVGIGVLVGAGVMLLAFTPLAWRWRPAEPPPRRLPFEKLARPGAWFTAVLVAILLATLVIKGPPPMDFSAESLRPRESGAYASLDRLAAKLGNDPAMLNLVVTGRDETETLARLRSAEDHLRAAQAAGDVRSFQTALPLCPDPAAQRANQPRLAALAAGIPRLEQTLADAGFTPEAFAFTRSVLNHWAAWAERPLPVWPEGEAARWILRRVASDNVALGLVHPAPGREDAVVARVQAPGTWLVSWPQLGRELERAVPGELLRLALGLGGIVLLLLFAAFRSVRELAVLVVTMALVFASLVGAMSLLGLSWNLFNLAAVLLLLGTGIDYALLLLLAAHRNGGDMRAAQAQVGLLITLCAASAVAGFGTIGWANHRGLASLGITCALGLALDALISIFLLPVLWRAFNRAGPSRSA